MKVACDACNAEYEVDESKIPPNGLAVKCTKCHSIFVIRPTARTPEPVVPVSVDDLVKEPEEAAPTAQPEAEPTPYWTLRREDGTTYPFPDFSTLQRWIVEHKALRDDEISNDGTAWRRVGDVPELAPFLEVVHRAQSGTFPAQPDEPQQKPQATPHTTLQMWATEQPSRKGRPRRSRPKVRPRRQSRSRRQSLSSRA